MTAERIWRARLDAETRDAFKLKVTTGLTTGSVVVDTILLLVWGSPTLPVHSTNSVFLYEKTYLSLWAGTIEQPQLVEGNVTESLIRRRGIGLR